MPAPVTNTSLVQNTTYKVVIPFYVYAALALLTATLLLLFSPAAFSQHYFNPRALAITHTMALGCGTMTILGASHQLVPVLIESKLYSNFLAYLSFGFAASGIPLLVYSFLQFNFGWIAQSGALLVNLAVVSFLLNMAVSIRKSKHENVHAVFVFTASAWLLVTTLIGLLLVFNFTKSILPQDSVSYLSLHAHIGIIGWFLLLVMGVGSRLIPMFLISKYNEPKNLWRIYFLVNGSLVAFIAIYFTGANIVWYLLPVALIVLAVTLFGHYCIQSYKQRIRKQVDEPMKVSLLSVILMVLPVVFLIVVLLVLVFSVANVKLVMAYGFSIFFGWITAIILGMTFKTLPFIVWNKIYHTKAGKGKTPNPKDLFSTPVFQCMSITYLVGFVVFVISIFLENKIVLLVGSLNLFIMAVLYNFNIFKMLTHKASIK
jgi:hypothetical protein